MICSHDRRNRFWRVCRSSWRLDTHGSEAVCSGETIEDWEVLDLLTSLVDKSLVSTEEDEGQTRYRLLETVRQYARDRLAESDAEAWSTGAASGLFPGAGGGGGPN